MTFRASVGRFVMIVEALRVLETQLEQAHQDILTLEELKTKALSDPDSLLLLLRDPEAGQNCFPRMQTVRFVPPVFLSRFQRRFTRHASQKYEQNFDYLMSRIMELQQQRPSQPTVSCLAPIGASPVPAAVSLNSPQDPVLAMRQKISDIAGWLVRPVSLPATLPHERARLERAESVPIVSDLIAAPIPSRLSIFSPQPRKAQSVQFSIPFAPSASADPSRSSSPANNVASRLSSPGKPSALLSSLVLASTLASPQSSSQSAPDSPKKRRRMIPGTDASHHNLPWTDEEKQRLLELMEIYPEEEIQSRRFAKIAAAIGTRTAAQVANRFTKLMTKRRKIEHEYDEEGPDGAIDPGEDIDETLGERAKQSKEYLEYQRLKRALEMIEENPHLTLHVGFKCDRCGLEPIVGSRWHCTKCQEPNAIDLCHDCYETADFVSTLHRPDHRFIRHVY